MIVPGPFRSDAVLRHANGQPCTLRFPGCDGGGETTVACHIRDGFKGMAQKASDHSIVFGCAHCHRLLDEGFTQLEPGEMHWHIVRGLQETWAILIRDGIIGFPHNQVTPLADRPVKPRKPPAERARVGKGKALQSRNEWPEGRKLATRPLNRKSEREAVKQ